MFGQPGPTSSTDGEPEDDDDNLSVSALDPDSVSSRLAVGSIGRRLRRVWRASGALAVFALIAVVVVAVAPHLPRSHPAPPQIPFTALAAPGDMASCLMGASWSPDGRRIAAVASTSCGAPYTGAGKPQPNAVIFDATTGHQVAAYGLDADVRAALARQGIIGADIEANDVSYFQATWSPDGRLLEVGFAIYSAAFSDEGVALITLAGAQRGQVRVALNQPNAVAPSPANGFALIPIQRWDVVTGSQTIIYLAPALAYRWLPSDVLVADEPLPANASALPPGASPATDAAIADGQAFSMWRSGFIAPVTAASCGSNGMTLQPLDHPYGLLTLTTTAWSPDSRYLLNALVEMRMPTVVSHPLAASNGGRPCDNGPPPSQLPTAPTHDKGLSAALALLDTGGGNQLAVTWSPDGRRLAVSNFVIAQDTSSLIVYDSASGAVLQRFSGEQFGSTRAQYGATQNPVWSPDGSHLLLTVSGVVPKLVILGPAAFGR